MDNMNMGNYNNNNYNYQNMQNMNMQNMTDNKFTLYLILSILQLFCCNQITGIISLAFVIMASSSFRTDMNKSNKYYKWSKNTMIIGVVMSIIITIVVTVACVLLSFSVVSSKTSEMIGEEYILQDDSYMVLNNDMTFEWYLTEEDLTDNYYLGTYEVYTSKDAYDKIVELEEYGITEDELDDYFARNEGSKYYNLDNLTLLILNTNEMIYEGESRPDIYQEEKCYYGYYYNDMFSAIRMDSGSINTFTKIAD